MLPKQLILIRHGESEGNVAKDLGKKGDVSRFTPEFMDQHSQDLKLTELGMEQARSAGRWLIKQGYAQFDRYYASEHRRAYHTAALLGLADAKWYLDFRVRERDYGLMDIAHPDDIKGRFAEYQRVLKKFPFYGKPANGESIAELVERLYAGIVSTLHRECAGRVIVVTHGEVLWAFRVLLERIHVREYDKLDRSKHDHDRIHNAQILEYSRVNPAHPHEVLSHMGWVRSVCPWDETLSSNAWQKIERKTFSTEELLTLSSS